MNKNTKSVRENKERERESYRGVTYIEIERYTL